MATATPPPTTPVKTHPAAVAANVHQNLTLNPSASNPPNGNADITCILAISNKNNATDSKPPHKIPTIPPVITLFLKPLTLISLPNQLALLSLLSSFTIKPTAFQRQTSLRLFRRANAQINNFISTNNTNIGIVKTLPTPVNNAIHKKHPKIEPKKSPLSKTTAPITAIIYIATQPPNTPVYMSESAFLSFPAILTATPPPTAPVKTHTAIAIAKFPKSLQPAFSEIT